MFVLSVLEMASPPVYFPFTGGVNVTLTSWLSPGARSPLVHVPFASV